MSKKWWTVVVTSREFIQQEQVQNSTVELIQQEQARNSTVEQIIAMPVPLSRPSSFTTRMKAMTSRGETEGQM